MHALVRATTPSLKNWTIKEKSSGTAGTKISSHGPKSKDSHKWKSKGLIHWATCGTLITLTDHRQLASITLQVRRFKMQKFNWIKWRETSTHRHYRNWLSAMATSSLWATWASSSGKATSKKVTLTKHSKTIQSSTSQQHHHLNSKILSLLVKLATISSIVNWSKSIKILQMILTSCRYLILTASTGRYSPMILIRHSSNPRMRSIR